MIGALRRVAPWLLVVAVLLGPVGLGGVGGLAATSRGCGVDCPCDEGHLGDLEATAAPCDDDPRAETHDHDGPCQSECPDDCPNCGCGTGVVLALFSSPLTLGVAPTGPSSRLTAADPVPSRACGGVFRPPRGQA